MNQLEPNSAPQSVHDGRVTRNGPNCTVTMRPVATFRVFPLTSRLPAKGSPSAAPSSGDGAFPRQLRRDLKSHLTPVRSS